VRYKLGEIVFQEGFIPQNFYIVAQGRVKMIKEGVLIRPNEVMGT